MSSQELIDAMREFRQDPVIAGVLRGDTESQRRPKDSAQPSINSMTETQLFYRSREVDRQSAGIENWIQHHRDALSASESKRLENRLRTEHMFAASQLEIGQLKAEHADVSARLGRQALELQAQRARDDSQLEALTYVERLNRTQQDIEMLSPLPQEPPGNLSSVSEQVQRLHQFQSVNSSVQTPSFLAPRGAILYEPSSEPVPYTTSGCLPTPNLFLDTSAEMGEIDEERNYAEKVKLIGLPAVASTPKSVASVRSPGNRQTPAAYTFSPSTDKLNKSKDAGVSIELNALREGIEQRDRTIRRLEKQLHEDHVYYETQLSRAKQDLHQAGLMAESRVSALRAQLDEAMARRNASGSLEYNVEEVQQKLQSVQQMYHHSVEEIKDASAAAMDELQTECNKRVQEVTLKAEQAVREAKDLFRQDRFDSLAKEKDALLTVLTKEMELALREAEATFRDSIYDVVSLKIREEVQVVFRKHLRTDVLPATQLKMIEDVRNYALQSIQKHIDGQCSEKSLQLREVVRNEVKTLEPEINKMFMEVASRQDHFTQTVDKTLLDSLISELRLLDVARKDIETESQQQELLEGQHRAKMQVYQNRVNQLSKSLETEQTFFVQISEQLGQEIQKKRDIDAMGDAITAGKKSESSPPARPRSTSPQPAKGGESKSANGASGKLSANSTTTIPSWMRAGK